ncbi:arginase family protein [Mechercharimyces sp. CAU 1602]|uniref:arginase family protein n=1 Tax=Mechercharimyces sp. CAU 1602 TaxID=2973933 RepID=UPI00216380A5|nr:arginase family protein [Mechercharimyces sp. CAU 1602]MCS1352499.1 arginase family protein [Mechercharimyces sp. CAU 1602]
MKPVYVWQEVEGGYVGADEAVTHFYKLDDDPSLQRRSPPRLCHVKAPMHPCFRFAPMVGHPRAQVVILDIPYAKGSCAEGSTVAQFGELLRVQTGQKPVWARLDEKFASGIRDLDDGGSLFSGLLFEDWGTLQLGQPEEPMSTLAEVVQKVLEEQQILFSLGGDHSLTYHVIQQELAYIEEPLIVIDFDAHHDCGTTPLLADEVNHANFIRHLLADERIAAIVQLGVRGVRSWGQWCEHPKLRQISAKKMKPETIESVLYELMGKHPRAVHYVTFDMDCLDPSQFPLVDYPVANGPTWEQVRLCLQSVFQMRAPLLGVDMVEGQGVLIEGKVPIAYEMAVQVFAHLLDGIKRRYSVLKQYEGKREERRG